MAALLELKIVASAKDGALGWLEFDGHLTNPDNPNSRRVFFPQPCGAMHWTPESTFHADGTLARTYGSPFTVHDVEIV